MAFEAPGASEFTFEAGADLSALQFHFVKMNANGQVVPVTATTDDVVGILQNKPAVIGEAATIWMAGISKLKTSAAVTAGAVIGPSANGRSVAAATKPMGRALDTTTGADQLGSVVFECRRPYQTAVV